ncbi:MAG: LysR family transcriptional regulator [Porcipelethomonas sp.]
MSEKFIRAEEVAEVMEISVAYAYKIIRKLNKELDDKGYITVTGRVNREYFNKRVYSVNLSEKKEGEE